MDLQSLQTLSNALTKKYKKKKYSVSLIDWQDSRKIYNNILVHAIEKDKYYAKYWTLSRETIKKDGLILVGGIDSHMTFYPIHQAEIAGVVPVFTPSECVSKWLFKYGDCCQAVIEEGIAYSIVNRHAVTENIPIQICY